MEGIQALLEEQPDPQGAAATQVPPLNIPRDMGFLGQSQDRPDRSRCPDSFRQESHRSQDSLLAACAGLTPRRASRTEGKGASPWMRVSAITTPAQPVPAVANLPPLINLATPVGSRMNH